MLRKLITAIRKRRQLAKLALDWSDSIATGLIRVDRYNALQRKIENS